MDIIAVNHLTKAFKTKKGMVAALDDIALTIKEGEFVAITGESGSGKSTLLQLIGGLDTPTSGEVCVRGEDITRFSDRQLSRFRSDMFGFVFQNFYLQPFLTVRQNVELPAVFNNMLRGSRTERTENIAKFLDIQDRLDHLPRELSGGQVQRAAILRAIYNQPPIILADEPTGNLDGNNARAVLDLLKKINKEMNATILLVTHDTLASSYADRVIHLDRGNIV